MDVFGMDIMLAVSIVSLKPMLDSGAEKSYATHSAMLKSKRNWNPWDGV
jgi:hypothetical protein